MSNGTTSHQANQCKMVSWKALTAACGTSASTSTCSPTSKRHARSSKHGGSTTTPTDRTRASMGSHQLSSQHAPIRGITGTDSPYERGQLGEQVTHYLSPQFRKLRDKYRLYLLRDAHRARIVLSRGESDKGLAVASP